MKLIIAFFMAWGNFITLPCPYKRWDNELKNMMLAFLPSVGAVVGVLWAVLLLVLSSITWIPGILAAVFCEAYIFMICGFMHLDGFMDCSDAILSRRPLEDRQRILKDPTVGAFAVVSLVLLLLVWFACMQEAIFSEIALPAFFLIPIVSRGLAGLQVMQCRPIGHSQYKSDFEKPKAGEKAASYIQLVIYAAIAAVYTRQLGEGALIALAVVTAACAAGSLIAGCYARRQLGGMSGDIAGYSICWAELAAVIALACV